MIPDPILDFAAPAAAFSKRGADTDAFFRPVSVLDLIPVVRGAADFGGTIDLGLAVGLENWAGGGG